MESQPTFPASFGELLQFFRKRKRLTQKHVAQQLGVHANTISSWELGTYLPATRGLVLELAQHLSLNNQEASRLLEASLTALAPHWLVPLPRNPFFTGREEILEALHTQLGVNQAVALTQSLALHGLGGVGKTQIALEYVYRHALEYSAVFWIGAETVESIVSSLLRIAEVLQLPGPDDKDQQRVVAAVRRWLSTHGQWLLIWDNVEDLALLDRFLPSTRSGAVLITTRCQTLGTLARDLELLPMGNEEGTLFLLRRAKVLEPEAGNRQVQLMAVRRPTEYAAASELVKVLGGLPLALDQAGAYLEATQCGLPAYLDFFHTRRAALLQQRGEGARDHPASVSTTFTLAITATAQRHPAVWDLLRVCALLQPDAIPEILFRQGGEHLGPALETACRDALEWDRVVAVACAYSLLSRQSEEQTLSLHRLVHAVLLDAMTEAEREQWARSVTAALEAVFPEMLPFDASEYATWKQCERLLAHALLCLQRTGADEESLTLASLAYKTAQYLRWRGRYAEAQPLYLRALRILEHTQGPDHHQVACLLNNLANLYREQGKDAEAQPLYRRALLIWEQVQGPDHPDVARPLNNLAILYADQGKYTEAQPLYLRALRILEHTQGPDHYQVGCLLNNLAELYSKQGKNAEAKPLFQRALYIEEQALGSDHPDVAYPLIGLAELYREQDNCAEAEALYQHALHIRVQALGPDHPQVAEPLNGLANLYREQGKDAEAEALYQRARSIREQQLGQQHPETAQTLHDLAVFRQKQGNLSEAISLAGRALSIRSQSLGDAHLKTVATRALAAQLLQKQTCA